MKATICFITSAFAIARISHTLEIRKITERIPEDSFARRVRVDGNGDCFVYEGDVQYDYNGTGSPAFGEGYKHIWKTCGVFDDVNGKQHTLLSTLSTLNGEDDDSPAVSKDGSKVCYHTKDLGGASVIASVDTENLAISYYGKVLTDDYAKRKSSYCEISSDGNVIVFQSSASLVKNVTNPSNKYQIYATYDHGASFVLPAGKDIANEGQVSLLSSYPQISHKGKYITYQAKIPYKDPSDTPYGMKTSELYLYSSKIDETERLTSFNENYCNLTYVYEKMKDYWGADNLTEEGVTKAANTQCNLAAILGWQTSGQLLGAGHGPARISDAGRFITYTAGFDHSNIRGTHEKPQVLTADNLFLHDTFLGLVWQISKEGDVGVDMESRIESFCCASASSSYQRGTCSKKREYTGFCCWQRTCWFPAQWPSISGDGTSIAYFSAYGLYPGDEENEVAKDYEVYHYHIPTSTRTVITNTSHADLDDAYPSISHSGEVVAFESDFDHSTGESITSNNQVFAAKLSYGCPNYTNASNYVANPDVIVKCDWPMHSSTGFSGYGVALELAMDQQSMMSKIPFTDEGTRNKNLKRLCRLYYRDIISNLAYSINVPESFLMFDKRQYRRCRKGKINGDSILINVAFVFSTEPLFDELWLNVGQPESWYNDTIFPQFNDTSSDFWKGYLLKTTKKIEKLDGLSQVDYRYIDWSASS